MNRRYCWRPDVPDQRDRVFSVAAAPRPQHVDLRSRMSAVEDQGNLGSCTGQAWAGALEYLERLRGGAFFDVSRLFIYYQERFIEHSVAHDSGAQIRDGAKALAKVGYCSEATWPYRVTKFAEHPPQRAYEEAATHRITDYFRCESLEAALQSLAAGYPVVFGFSVYESFEGQEVARTGVVNLPTINERLRGGHAVLMVGYDEPAKRVIVRNSWSAAWGDKGYFTMPYAYIASRKLADDFWTVRKG